MANNRTALPSLYTDAFNAKKKRIESASDLSRKGNIDQAIESLISFINSLDEYVTTSSCSGRIIIVGKDKKENSKKGCKWILTSHTVVDVEDVLDKVKSNEINMTFKFEPFILHVQCCDIHAAKRMQNCALSAGFRNSGSIFGRQGNITFAVRGTHGLEVPISDEQGVLVSDDYIRHITEEANRKMIENQKKIDKFSETVFSLTNSDGMNIQGVEPR